MVGKKKAVKSPVKSVTVQASAPLEDAVAKEEKRPTVTQVVEVVEEEVPKEKPVAALEQETSVPQASQDHAQPIEEPVKESIQEPVIQDVQMSEEIQHTPPMTAPTGEEVEKRKELVDEIFQKKIPEQQVVMPEISVHTKSSSSIYVWAIGVFVACAVIGGGLFFFRGKGGSLPSVVVIPTPTPMPASKTTPSPTPSTLARNAITIQVLNGGGKAGAATKMKNFLESKGYTVGATGNADNYNYDKTVVLVSSSKQAYLPLLESDLQGTYTLGTSSATLDNSQSYDARVIVGKE